MKEKYSYLILHVKKPPSTDWSEIYAAIESVKKWIVLITEV